MKAKIFKYWDRVRSSFWFFPAVMAFVAGALAFAGVALDERVPDSLTLSWDWSFTGGAEGASSLLGTIAGSMITIAGVVFSMTLVVLSLASSQLGPRLLRNFMRDKTTQVALGTFISTFLYCLLVLRTIRFIDEVEFVPHLSVTGGVLLAVVSVGVLIYFIHHVSVSIQANEVVAQIGMELIEEINRLFPEYIGVGEPRIPRNLPDAGFLDTLAREARPVCSIGDGYIQFIDEDALLALAVKEDVVIRLEHRPGHYVVAASPLVYVWPGNRINDQFVNRVNSAFSMDNQRTSGQDIELAVNQLVEIALRALSPSVNDPFTAITCVDQLGTALCRLAQREMPSRYRHDTKDQLRVLKPVVTFPDVTDTAFNQIRQYSRSCTAVTIRLLETIAVIAGFVHRPEDRAALLRHAGMIVRGARGGLPEDEDRQKVEECYRLAEKRLSELADSEH